MWPQNSLSVILCQNLCNVYMVVFFSRTSPCQLYFLFIEQTLESLASEFFWNFLLYWLWGGAFFYMGLFLVFYSDCCFPHLVCGSPLMVKKDQRWQIPQYCQNCKRVLCFVGFYPSQAFWQGHSGKFSSDVLQKFK